MSIMSYLAYPTLNKKEILHQQLLKIPGCQVRCAENQDLLILITESNSPEEENQLQDRLQSVDSLDCLALVSGFEEDNQEGVKS